MKKVAGILGLVVCGLILGGTFFLLLQGRIQKGDIYPPSSSLRSDPLGTMMLFESLGSLPGISVTRDHKNSNQLPDAQSTTYLHLGGKAAQWKNPPKDLSDSVTRFLMSGGRLVVLLSPEFEKPERKKESEKTKEEDKVGEEKKINDKPDNRPWIFALETISAGESGSLHSVWNSSDQPFPAVLEWRSDVVLTGLDETWKTIYRREEGSVVAEKKLGPGTLVIATDSYFVSNEAMVRDRHPELLAWLVSPGRNILFDEAHHGVVENPGIAALARKYRLHGGVVVLLILALLFVWKNSSPLSPRQRKTGAETETVAGRDSMSGFTALLRRNIPTRDLITTCLTEWKKSALRSSRVSAPSQNPVEEILGNAPDNQDPVATYKQISKTLQHQKPV
jgi:hypothetical protein